MKLKFLQPTTPSQRHLIQLNKTHLSKKSMLKIKIKGIKKCSGRNNSGKITVRHKGGGHKKKFRKINFNRTNESTGIVCSLEYDPNRNTSIASVYDFSENTFYYILATINLKIGDIVQSGSEIKSMSGNSLPISQIPAGNLIHNISQRPYSKSIISRSAGTYSILEEKTLNLARLKLTSGKYKYLSINNYATIGVLSNQFCFLLQKGKAGRSRWLNKRPTVRGVAMNPIDHPHGGGEGKKSGKSKTPWGKFNKKIAKNEKI